MSVLVAVDCRAADLSYILQFAPRVEPVPGRQVLFLAPAKYASLLPKGMLCTLPNESHEQAPLRAIELFLTSAHEWLLFPNAQVLSGIEINDPRTPAEWGLNDQNVYVGEIGVTGEGWDLSTFMIPRGAALQVRRHMRNNSLSFTQFEEAVHELHRQGAFGMQLLSDLLVK